MQLGLFVKEKVVDYVVGMIDLLVYPNISHVILQVDFEVLSPPFLSFPLTD